MSEDFRKISAEELEKIAGGAKGKVGIAPGPVKVVHGLAPNTWLAIRSEPRYDASNELGQLYNGDVVQVMGNDAMVDRDFDGPGETFYTWVYSPKLNISGWVNSRFI